MLKKPSINEASIDLYLAIIIFLFFFHLDKPVFHMDTKHGNAIELIEGSPAIVNMTATANPLPIEYEWSKESQALELEKLFPIADRMAISGGVLNFTNVKRQDSGYYTISATNAEGTTQTKIKIDVLYAPR